MTIEFYYKEYYGNEGAYIADKGLQSIWYSLTGRKTIRVDERIKLSQFISQVSQSGQVEWVEILKPR